MIPPLNPLMARTIQAVLNGADYLDERYPAWRGWVIDAIDTDYFRMTSCTRCVAGTICGHLYPQANEEIMMWQEVMDALGLGAAGSDDLRLGLNLPEQPYDDLTERLGLEDRDGSNAAWDWLEGLWCIALGRRSDGVDVIRYNSDGSIWSMT